MAFFKLQDRAYLTSFDAAEGAESDYGSDLDQDAEQIVDGLLSLLETTVEGSIVLESIEEDAPLASPKTAIIPKIAQRDYALETDLGLHILPRAAREASVEIEYDEPSRTAFRIAQDERPEDQRGTSVEPGVEVPVEDTRSPIQRFRTAPKKPLSVTDLSSPAWCELQYWFTLVKFGRKRATPAMKQGTKVHKALEEEIYTAVPITTTTKEDMYGLKIWNVIQGLRTLRVTGMTRELEVWGIIEGELVNGIIDELSYTCPDVEAEERLLKPAETPDETKTFLPRDQTTLEDFFKSSGSSNLESPSSQPQNPPTTTTTDEPTPRIYIQDVKTTRKRTLPSGPSVRPTEMQLMLYHHLLTSLTTTSTTTTNALPASTFCARYRLSPTAAFSPTFLAQLSSADFNFLSSASSQTSRTDELFGDAAAELAEHASLEALWRLMLEEYRRTFVGVASGASGSGSGSEAKAKAKAKAAVPTLSPLLTASYRLAVDGSLLGNRAFVFDAQVFDAYVRDGMRWWRGEREARGVEVEEAFKCGYCEFAEGCEWRMGKVEEGVRKARLRKEERRRSEV
ncbi:MAG: hypothetical protein Q9165_008536 [Trypethelium subeluteriae]